MYLRKTPRLLKKVFSNIVWNSRDDHRLFLSFDDGPHPQSTHKILSILNDISQKATFFCLGENVIKYPKIFEDIINQGHQVGNHGYKHMSGWATSSSAYIQNLNRGKDVIKSHLFRPPYGRMTLNQYKTVQQDNQVVLWDLMPGDFDPSRSDEDIHQFIKKEVKKDSILVLHDRPHCIEKAERGLRSLVNAS